jgi:SH3-like domain-containing protein
MNIPYRIEQEVSENIKRLNMESSQEQKLQIIYMWVKQGMPLKVFIRTIEEISK